MSVTPITIKIFQQEEETNAEADIPLESKRQESVPLITTFPVIFCSPEHGINPTTNETMNMRALYIQQSLVTHCLCIDDITGSLA